MSVLTTILRLRKPNPDGSDPAQLATIIGNLADDVDLASAAAYTAAQLAALPSAQKPPGRYVFNSDTGEPLISTGGAGLKALATVEALGASVAAAVPIGSIVAYGGSSAPAGWHLCDGSAHGSAALQAILGSTNTPDLRSRFIVGAGQGSGLTSRTLKATGGEETHALTVAEMPSHNHGGASGSAGSHSHSVSGGTSTDGSHTHLMDSAAGSGALRDSPYQQDGQPGVKTTAMDAAGSHSHSVSGTAAAAGDHGHTIASQGGGAAHNTMPPFYALTYIIRKV